jgi:hypothetical protein
MKGSARPKKGAHKVCQNNFASENNALNFSLRRWSFTNHPHRNHKFVRSGYKNLNEWVQKATDLDPSHYREVSRVRPSLGGHFEASRQQIRNAPLSFYTRLKEQQRFANAEVDHFIERTWTPLFCATSLRAAPSTDPRFSK